MVIKQLEEKNLTIEEAVEILGISERQTYRILKRVRDEGSRGVTTGQEERNQIVDIPRN